MFRSLSSVHPTLRIRIPIHIAILKQEAMPRYSVRVCSQNQVGALTRNLVVLALLYLAAKELQGLVVRVSQPATASDLHKGVSKFLMADEGRDT